MTIIHTCPSCIQCPSCGHNNCATYLPPNKMEWEEQDGWVKAKCTNCKTVLSKYETLASLRANNKIIK